MNISQFMARQEKEGEKKVKRLHLFLGLCDFL